jgi:hypothetical protein
METPADPKPTCQRQVQAEHYVAQTQVPSQSANSPHERENHPHRVQSAER